MRAPDPRGLTVVRPLRVVLACTGLGRERRGFEAFTRSCAAALASEPSLDLQVFAGGHDDARPSERVIPNLPRSGGLAQVVGAMTRRDPYYVEQLSFFAGALPALVRVSPDLVYFADLNFGNACWHWRRLSGARFKMLFYNGGNSRMPYTRCDHVQQVTPTHLEAAVVRGESRERQTLLPHGIDLNADAAPADPAARRAAREHLALPLDGEVLLSVGLLDRRVKRTDLLIESVALLPESRPFLLLAGADGPDGDAIRSLATARLGQRWSWRSVPANVMPWVYRAADRFALFSEGEGFGLAFVEALAAGLPVLAHDDPTTRYVVGDAGLLREVKDAASARDALRELLAAPTDLASGRARIGAVRSRFSWDLVRPRYVELFRRVAGAVT